MLSSNSYGNEKRNIRKRKINSLCFCLLSLNKYQEEKIDKKRKYGNEYAKKLYFAIFDHWEFR